MRARSKSGRPIVQNSMFSRSAAPPGCCSAILPLRESWVRPMWVPQSSDLGGQRATMSGQPKECKKSCSHGDICRFLRGFAPLLRHTAASARYSPNCRTHMARSPAMRTGSDLHIRHIEAAVAQPRPTQWPTRRRQVGHSFRNLHTQSSKYVYATRPARPCAIRDTDKGAGKEWRSVV